MLSPRATIISQHLIITPVTGDGLLLLDGCSGGYGGEPFVKTLLPLGVGTGDASDVGRGNVSGSNTNSGVSSECWTGGRVPSRKPPLHTNRQMIWSR